MRLNLFVFIMFFALFVWGCHHQKTASKNRVISTDNFTSSSENSRDTVIFEGKENTVYLEYLNAFFNDENSRNVVIVEGNGNVFKLKHHHLIDNSKNSSDTIILRGNDNYVEYLQSYFMDNSVGSSDKSTLTLEKEFIVEEVSQGVHVFDTSKIENQLSHEWMSLFDAYHSYLIGALRGNLDAAFYLGEMYELGVGPERSIEMAKYYYQIAANKGHKHAQSSLGSVFEREWEGSDQNLEKSIYWYRKAAKQGDAYAKERLLELE